MFIGRKIIFLPTCHSTNDTAASLLRGEGVFEGTIIVTSNQTAGRGQRGNQWEAQRGKNLTFSLILKPTFLTASDQFQLNVAISLGIHAFLSGYFATKDVKIKWPNDLYHKDKKLGGVLIENVLKKHTIECAIVGIGLNVNQTEFAEPKAISMINAGGQLQDYNLEQLLAELAELLEKHYFGLRNGSWPDLYRAYLEHLYWYGEQHTFRTQGQWLRGTIVGIDPTGRLLLESNGTTRSFDLKEIEFIE